jgi:hypothetical protein
MTTHELKVEPRFLDALLDGTKAFEVRKNDRDYQVGDILVFTRTEDLGDYPVSRLVDVAYNFEIAYVQPLADVPELADEFVRAETNAMAATRSVPGRWVVLGLRRTNDASRDTYDGDHQQWYDRQVARHAVTEYIHAENGKAVAALKEDIDKTGKDIDALLADLEAEAEAR